jgi:hypothetical protein
MLRILVRYGAARAFGVVLEPPQFHLLSAAKVSGGVFSDSSFVWCGERFECCTNEIPINVWNVGCLKLAPILPTFFCHGVHDGFVQFSLVHLVEFSVLEMDSPPFVVKTEGVWCVAQAVQVIPKRLAR